MKASTLLSLIAAVSLSGLFSLHAEEAPPPATGPVAAAPGEHPHGPKGFGGKDRKFGRFDWDHDRGQRPEGGGFGHMLQLTPEQREKVKAIWEAQKPKIEAIRAEERAKMQAVFAEIDKQVRPLLTEEQAAVLDNAKKLRESEAALRKSQKATDTPAKK